MVYVELYVELSDRKRLQKGSTEKQMKNPSVFQSELLFLCELSYYFDIKLVKCNRSPVLTVKIAALSSCCNRSLVSLIGDNLL